MKWKYMTIFLMGLLCLVSSDELFSQHCLKMSYDKNGNRTVFNVVDCSNAIRGDDVVDDNVVDNYEDETDELFVYPNPNDGRFRVNLKTDDENSLSKVYVYDNKGILICQKEFIETIDIDISSYPAGLYLLRIIRDDSVRSVIVVKF